MYCVGTCSQEEYPQQLPICHCLWKIPISRILLKLCQDYVFLPMAALSSVFDQNRLRQMLSSSFLVMVNHLLCTCSIHPGHSFSVFPMDHERSFYTVWLSLSLELVLAWWCPSRSFRHHKGCHFQVWQQHISLELRCTECNGMYFWVVMHRIALSEKCLAWVFVSLVITSVPLSTTAMLQSLISYSLIPGSTSSSETHNKQMFVSTKQAL